MHRGGLRTIGGAASMLEHVRLEIAPEKGGTEGDRAALATLARELPSLDVGVTRPGARAPALAAPRIDGAAWEGSSWDPFAFDAIVLGILGRGHVALQLVAGHGRTALEVVTRYQRYVEPPHALDPTIRRVLEFHRDLHDLNKPLVSADFDHARDAWMWLLRLSPDASLAVQVAVLFHDVERLVSEAEFRCEHQARSYAAFKHAHAHAGAAMLRGVLVTARVDDATLVRAEALVRHHEQPGDDPELRLLNDADALSFFSLNSPGFAHYFGRLHTARKVAYTLARMSPAARARLATVRLRDDVSRMVNDAERDGAP